MPIILTEKELLVLIDFGLSKNLSGEDYTSLFTTHSVGTPVYMAPEQIFADGEPDQQSDIWSLGVILYQILTGKLPFYDRNPHRLAHAIQYQCHNSVLKHKCQLPPDLDIVCNRALQKNKNRRYHCVEEMLTDIEFLVRGQKISPIAQISANNSQPDTIDQKYKLSSKTLLIPSP